MMRFKRRTLAMSLNATQSEVVFFGTSLDWMGLGFADGKIQKLAFGYATRDLVAARFDPSRWSVATPSREVQSWLDQLQKYSRGADYDFHRLPIDLTGYSDFQTEVLNRCRQIPHGQCLTYGELAEQVGSPGAGQAVGTVMRKNRIPLIIPCHRVITQNGLGKFSAPRGTEMKRRLLQLEGCLRDQGNQKWLFG